MSGVLEEFLVFQNLLVEALAPIEDVLGLMFAGSAAALDRVDKYSDQDFYLIVRDGCAESFRQDLGWLPDSEEIVLSPRETEHGLKVLYKNGTLLEFAVFEDGELLSHMAPFDNRVALDKSDITQKIAAITKKPVNQEINPQDTFALFLTLLQIGAGRVMRGEVLAGSQHIKGHALGRLIDLIRHFEPESSLRSDQLDRFRRFEFDHAEPGEKLGLMLAKEPLVCALEMLDFAETLPIAKQFLGAVAQVRRYLMA
jgi:hypothetical protein